MRNDQSLVTIDVSIIRSTRLAVQVTDGEVIEWLPRSQIIKRRFIDVDANRFEMVVPKWLAAEKGMV